MSTSCLVVFAFCFLLQAHDAVSIDYGDALTKSLLFFEAQRSGKLPSDQRIEWRGDSALFDGDSDGIDLAGGYYDAGDNVKFGFPMAFTVTMLAWSVTEFKTQLSTQDELTNALTSIKWGTDYLIKAHPEPGVLYGEVGSGESDHICWQRPEDMTTPRNVYRIDEQHPGTDLAGETAAAFAASSLAFEDFDPEYSLMLLDHAKQLFNFAAGQKELYQISISDAWQFYSSSGYEDELLWAAAWLHRATSNNTYLRFIEQSNKGGTREMFSWDDKFVGAQVLIAKSIFEGELPGNGILGEMKRNAEHFICNCIQKGNNNIKKTEGGILWFQEWANLQYVTSTSFILTVYADFLAKSKSTVKCVNEAVGAEDINAFVRSQVDYILGSNPRHMSYMVGFGENYPKQVHHRGASIESIKTSPELVDCQAGFEWFHRNADDPNVLVGAIVGGPNKRDEYNDTRDSFKHSEPATASNAPLVGVLAKLAS